MNINAKKTLKHIFAKKVMRILINVHLWFVYYRGVCNDKINGRNKKKYIPNLKTLQKTKTLGLENTKKTKIIYFNIKICVFYLKLSHFSAIIVLLKFCYAQNSDFDLNENPKPICKCF